MKFEIKKTIGRAASIYPVDEEAKRNLRSVYEHIRASFSYTNTTLCIDHVELSLAGFPETNAQMLASGAIHYAATNNKSILIKANFQ